MSARIVRTEHDAFVRMDAVIEGKVVFSVGFPLGEERQGIADMMEDTGYSLKEYDARPEDVMLESMRQLFGQMMTSLY